MKNLTLLFLFLSAQVWGQTAQIDSLKNELKKTNTTTQKIDIWNKLAAELINEDRKLMREYAQNALDAAQKENYSKGLLEAHYYMGYYFHLENNGFKATPHYEQALEFAKKLKDEDMLWAIRNNIAFLKQENNQFEEALNYYQLNLQRTDPNYLAHTYRNISDLYNRQNRWDKTAEYLYKAFKIYEDLGKDYSIESAYVADLLGNAYTELKLKEKAIEYYQIALKIRQMENDPSELVNSYETLARFAEKNGQYAEARQQYEKALKIYEQIKDQESTAMMFLAIGKSFLEEKKPKDAAVFFQKALSLKNYLTEEGKIELFGDLGEFYTQNNELEQAEVFLKKALFLAEKNNQSQWIAKISLRLAEFYEKKNDFGEALKALKTAYTIQDTTFSESLRNRIAQIEIKYKVPSLERQNNVLRVQAQNLEKENRIVRNGWIITILVGLLSVIILFFFLKNRRKNQILAQKEEIIKAQEQINAYFASELHDGVKSKLRLAMRQTETDTLQILQEILDDITFISEKTANKQHLSLPKRISSFLQRLPQNTENELMRKFVKDENAPWDKIDPMISLHLFRIMTEAVSNILAHAQDATFMEIRLEMRNNHIYLLVADDGKGMTETQIQESMGQGLQNMQNRVDVLQGTLKISSLAQDEGTTIEVLVPMVLV